MQPASHYRAANQHSDNRERTAPTPRPDNAIVQSRGAPFWVAPFYALIGLAACTSTSHMPPAPATPPVYTQQVSAPPPYRMQVGDILAVRLMLESGIERGGHRASRRPYLHHRGARRTGIRPHHAGPATGARSRLRDRSASNPRLSVVVKSFAPTRIYVGGEVNNPGEFVNVGPASRCRRRSRAPAALKA